MKKILRNVALFGTISLCVGCGNASKVYSVNDLAGEWTVVEVEGKAVKAEVESFLGFQADGGQLYGNAGCNSLMGTFEVGNGRADALSFGALGSTKRMCADMETEDALLMALGQVRRFAFQSADKLLLTDADGKELIELVPRKAD